MNKVTLKTKIKIFICTGVAMFTVWTIACIHGILFLTNPKTPECEVERRKVSSFYIEGDIVSAKYLYNDHGYKYLICLRPTVINIYKNEFSKSTPFWGVYDKKKDLVYFIISYWNPEIEKKHGKMSKLIPIKNIT